MSWYKGIRRPLARFPFGVSCYMCLGHPGDVFFSKIHPLISCTILKVSILLSNSLALAAALYFSVLLPISGASEAWSSPALSVVSPSRARHRYPLIICSYHHFLPIRLLYKTIHAALCSKLAVVTCAACWTAQSHGRLDWTGLIVSTRTHGIKKESWYWQGLMVSTRIHGIKKESWYWQGLMV